MSMPRSHQMIFLAIALMVAWLFPGSAQAQSCWESGVGHVAFGTVGPTGGSATGSVSITCQKPWTAGVSAYYFRLCLNIPGGVPINTLNPRRMSNYGSGQMQFELFSDPAHTQRIANGSPAAVYSKTVMISQAGNGQATLNFPVYGKVYPGQSLPAGAYQSQQYSNVRWVVSTSAFPPEGSCSSGATVSVYLNATATWANSCTILAVNNLAFGPHDNLASTHDGQTTLSITCPVGTPWQVGRGNGTNYSGGNRRMARIGGGSFISYGLFRNTSRTQPWGATIGTNTVGGTGTGNPENLTIYGRTPIQATPLSGEYEDTVQVVLTY